MTSKYFDVDYVPGSTNVLSSAEGSASGEYLKRGKNGMVLMPQPSDSPNDPLNWSVSRKILHALIVCYITALTAAIANDAGSASDALLDEYGITNASQNTGAGILFIFIGWPTLFFAPLSSLLGRRITYLVCLLSGTVGSVWFGTSTKVSDTIFSQIFVGLSEACAEAQVQQSLADVFFQHQLGSVLTIYIMATSLGTFLGPLLASLIVANQSFRWIGWWGAIITGVTLLVVLFFCEETVFDRNKHIPIYESPGSCEDGDETQHGTSEKLNKESRIEAIENEQEKPAHEQTCVAVRTDDERDVQTEELTPYLKRIAIVTPAENITGWGVKQYFHLLYVNMKVFSFPAVWLSGLLWGLQDTYLSFYLTTQDNFYDAPWNYGNIGVGLVNVATLTGALIGCFVSGYLSDLHVMWLAKRNGGAYEPEYRLYLLFIAMVISPLGLILFGFASEQKLPRWVMYGGLGLVGYGWGSIGDTAMSYLMDSYPEMIIQGMVGVSIINNTLGSVFTFCCSYWLKSSGTVNTYITLGVIDFVSIGFIIPTLYFGKTWRRWSKDLYVEMVRLIQGLN